MLARALQGKHARSWAALPFEPTLLDPTMTNRRLVAVFLAASSALVTPWLGRLLFALLLYYGTPGQSWQFYAIGFLVVLAITAVLILLWVATVRALYRALPTP